MIDHQHPVDSILNRAEVQNMKNDINSLKANGSELVKDIRNESSEIVRGELSKLKKSGIEKLQKAENHVKNRPAQSIAMGVVAGMALSYLFSRRR